MHNSFHVARSSKGKWQINVFSAKHLATPDCLSFDVAETGIISILCLFNFKWTARFHYHGRDPNE